VAGRQTTDDRRQTTEAMLPAPLRDVLDVFALVTDPVDRASLLISYADRFSPVPPEVATPPYAKDHLVPYCESEAYVWLVPQADGTARLYFAVENPSEFLRRHWRRS